MDNNRKQYLLKNTAIFAVGNFGTKIITFFLIPIYTNSLSTSEYGIIDLIVTGSTIVVPLLSLNISEAVMRFNLDKDADQNKITKVGITILFYGTLLAIVIIPLCSLFDKVSGFARHIYFYVIFSASSQILLADLRGKELLVQYSIGNIINTLLVAIFNILFLLVLKMGIRGYLLAYIIAFAIVTFYALIVGKGYASFNEVFDLEISKKMLKYSIVLIPNSFMWWIMNSSDHIMVTSMVGATANGIYAISYKLPTLIASIMQIFNQAWSYSAIREEGSEDLEIYTNKVFGSMISIAMFVAIGMLTFVKPFLKIYVSNDYYLAWKYTPFLIIGYVFSTLGTFISTSYTVHKDSKGFLISGSFGAMLNIIMNWILIPIIGVYGAAIATGCSYIAVFIFRLFHTKKYFHYKLLSKEFVAGLTILFISTIFMFIDNGLAQIIQILLLMCGAFVYKEMWVSYIGIVLKKMNKKRL